MSIRCRLIKGLTGGDRFYQTFAQPHSTLELDSNTGPETKFRKFVIMDEPEGVMTREFPNHIDRGTYERIIRDKLKG